MLMHLMNIKNAKYSLSGAELYNEPLTRASLLAGSASIGRTTCQPDLTTFLQPRHIPTQGYNITQLSAPDDGHMVARNMLSNY